MDPRVQTHPQHQRPRRMKRPPSPERLEQARRLLEDGASQRETCRTTGIHRTTLRKYFPGKGWTFVEGGKFRALTRED
jgi:DNA invertase Pin-like site-specific DNA recombinase